jgi:hypothetical protein
MTTFTFHTDPSHGWLEVPVTELLKALLTPGNFSAYSYQQGNVVYLEEDCDAPVFIRSYEAHVGPISVTEKYSHYTHWIRSLPRIECIMDDDLPF